MTYLKNAWYAAAISNEVTTSPISRTICDHPIALFRGEAGRSVALFDACPHRFAPLSLGRVQDGTIMCGYHGLRFGSDGRCVHNPHGKGTTPAALAVRAFPTVEKCGVVWIWMGSPEAADPAALPAHLSAYDQPGFIWEHGHLAVDAPYEMVADNLLDLSHVEFLHTFLAAPGISASRTLTTWQEGDVIRSDTLTLNAPITALFRLLREGDPAYDGEETGDLLGETHWTAPANIYLDTRTSRPGEAMEKGISVPTYHFLTPATEDTAHYFWIAGWDRRTDSAEVGDMLKEGIVNAFANEDEPMIRACRSRMKSSDLMANRPVLLPIDESAVLARRVLARFIAAEA